MPLDSIAHGDPLLGMGLEAKESLRFLDWLLTNPTREVRRANPRSITTLAGVCDMTYQALARRVGQPFHDLTIYQAFLNAEAALSALGAVDRRAAVDEWPGSVKRTLRLLEVDPRTIATIAGGAFTAAGFFRTPKAALREALVPNYLFLTRLVGSEQEDPPSRPLTMLQIQADSLGYDIHKAEKDGTHPTAAADARAHLDTAHGLGNSIHWEGYSALLGGQIGTEILAAKDCLVDAGVPVVNLVFPDEFEP
jgi:hypothetical protein